ncbi:hypothetical protein [Filomicrobium sp.]|uniref:hypothetical protein n=1 Tax=Filomicrobium sp. TaxID=2024831 RepID=UPI00258AE290|nr:hypothetical protein [Filomicrobium sp.]MCV0371730.1 hypothetical protein [Filomicrobium sp.]
MLDAATAKDLEALDEHWLALHDNPWLFATGVLGFLPYNEEDAALTPQEFKKKHGADAVMLEQWQDEFLRPENFFTDSNGKPTDNPRHSVRSGHGVGKGTTIAILALWFVSTHWDAKAVLTANSQDQLRDNNWPEIKKWWRQMPPHLRDNITVDEERMYIKGHRDMVFVTRRTASRHNTEALQGIHASWVLYLCDEASGIFETVFEVAQGSLSTPGAMACLFSNPTRRVGFFHDTHNKPAVMERWKRWHVNCEDVPRARHHIDDVIATYGKDSNKYRVRVLGEFPKSDDDTVIPLELVEAAKGRNVVAVPVWPVWGLDVARFGDDRTCLAKRQGNILLEPITTWKNLKETQIAGRIIDMYRHTPNDMKPKEICIDVIGYGAGVKDILEEPGSPVQHIITGVNVAETEAIKPENFRLRDDLWWSGREWFEAKDCRIPKEGCDGLIRELTVVTYDFTASGKRLVMPKKDMKKELGYSPDEADAFLHTFKAGVYPREPERHRRYTPPRRNRDPWAS